MRKGISYKKISEVCTVVSGATPKTSVPEFWGEGHFWITPAELDERKIIDSTERQITSEALKSTNLRLLPAGTVLLSSRAPIGKVAICGVPMYCNQGFKNCICTKEINNNYLYYFLISKKEYLNSLGRGATFKEISKSIVENVEIPLPNIEVQKNIVSELDLINQIIEKRKAQLKDLDSLAQSLFYEMFGDPVENEMGWDLHTIQKISSFRRGSFPQPYGNPEWYDGESSMPFVQVADIQENDFNLVGRTKNRISLKAQPLSVFVPKGTVLVSLQGSIGKVAITQYDSYVDRTVAIFTKLDEELCSKFFFAFILRFVFAEKRKKARGISIKTITKEEFSAFECPLPPLPLQQTFASRIEAIEEEKQKIQSSLKDLDILLASRMQYWFD